MDWRTLLIILVKGVLQAWADEVDPEGRYDDDPKEAPQPRKAESPPKAKPPASPAKDWGSPPKAKPPADPSENWGPPTEAPAVSLIRIETDAGVTVAAASFVGDECFGITKVERTRQPGESRRARRQTQAVPTRKAPREPWVTGFIERANASLAQLDHARRVEEVAAAMSLEPAQPQVRPPRTRPRGDTLPISSLSPATLIMLKIGEPTTCVLKAA